MAAVPITIVGTMTSDGETKQVTISGVAALSGLEVGGGPIVPPVSPGVPTHPIMLPGMPGWGDPHPAHPIVLPTPPPPTIWPPGPGIDFPSHPIVIPPPVDPGKPPIEAGSIIVWKPVWTPDKGWFIVGVPNVPHPAPSK